MAHLGWGRQPAVSGAAVGALISGAGGGRHPRRASLPGTVVQSQPLRVPGQDLQTGSSLHPNWLLMPIPSASAGGVGTSGAAAGWRWESRGGGRVPVSLAQGGELPPGTFCLLPAGTGPAGSMVPCLGGPCPASQAAGLAASLLDAGLELPLRLPDALSRGLLEAPDLTSQRCPCLGGLGPLLGFGGVQTASSSEKETAKEVPCTAAFAKHGGCLC